MSVTIPYVRDLEFEYGQVDALSPLVRRVIAKNASAFTFHGTGTYIIGHGEVAVVDPGPADEEHVAALLKALEGETITHVLVTHTHTDHSPGCRILARSTDAPTYAYGPHGAGKAEQGIVVEEGGDMEFVPDVEVRDGDVIEGNGWSVECVHTPGHTSNHICFALREEQALFSGDHVMGWSTSIVSPPDGDMGDYLRSLNKLLCREDECYWPTHGPRIEQPRRLVRAFIEHRRARDAQILTCLNDGVTKITAMVPLMYQGVATKLYPAAARSVLAHLVEMVADGRATCSGEPSVEAIFGPG
jgi:glyoxylase-like metal-dependent hydrolase (beta-lactamase superfamily II)